MQAIVKIMELLGVTKDKDLAQKLGLSNSSTISSWKKRGAVPPAVLREWAIKYGKPVEWFTGETVGGTDKEKPQVPEHLRRLFEEISKVFPDSYSLIEKSDKLSKVMKELRDDES